MKDALDETLILSDKWALLVLLFIWQYSDDLGQNYSGSCGRVVGGCRRSVQGIWGGKYIVNWTHTLGRSNIYWQVALVDMLWSFAHASISMQSLH